jgi:NADH:ubiquinone oxidoreductase subunit F (NADH-binding)/NADH:ubiquinone oxidoreductase subunit E
VRRTLIHDLNDLQHEHGHLRRSDLEALARRSGRPLYEIQGLLSFYPHFRTEPPPAHEVTLCRDMSCWLRDGADQGASVEAALAGRGDVAVKRVSCIGRCDCAPAATVNERPCRVQDVIDLVDGREVPPLETPAQSWETDPYESASDRYGVLRAALAGEISREEIVARLEGSGLRGMGGAGFPTGLKWKLVAGEPATPKYVICNADESEPGTFKDREILRQLPHLVIEGMLLGMFVVGAGEGIIFVRHEYGPEEDALRAELREARERGHLSGDRDIEIFTSPGGYILGEETALLDCLEGRRGEPRNKPPFPGTRGLWGQPTLINNVETFHHVPTVVGFGERFEAQGRPGHKGLKFISVSGHVERPGVYCVPMGTTVAELIEQAGGMQDGRELAAFAPGGASSNFLPAGDRGVELDFATLQEAGSMLGSGAMVAVAEGTDVLALATNVLEFFSNESCGKCVPCRVGSRKAVSIMHTALAGPAANGGGGWQETVTELEEALRLTSICGLGQVALGPVLSVLRNFPAGEPVSAP